jgi:fimbrial chaperone protein
MAFESARRWYNSLNKKNKVLPDKALIEGGGASLSVPVSGRLALAVYVAVNGAQPTLEFKESKIAERNGRRTPVVMVTNT